jgi:hypothetical protein
MKKIVCWAMASVLCLSLAGAVLGCSAKSNGQNQNPASPEPKDAVEWDGVQGKVLTGDYPKEISAYLEENKEKETQQALNINNRTYIVMTMGEKSSAGYQIQLIKVSLQDGTLMVEAKYQKPAKDEQTATVMTYPSLVIETDDIYEGHYLIDYVIEK